MSSSKVFLKYLKWCFSIYFVLLLSWNISFNVILALTPSLLVFFSLRGESERGSWSHDYPPGFLPWGGRGGEGYEPSVQHPEKSLQNLRSQMSKCLPGSTSNRRTIVEKSFETPSGHWLRKGRWKGSEINLLNHQKCSFRTRRVTQITFSHSHRKPTEMIPKRHPKWIPNR